MLEELFRSVCVLGVFVFVVVIVVGVATKRIWVEHANEPVFESALAEVDDESEFEIGRTKDCTEFVAFVAIYFVGVGEDFE